MPVVSPISCDSAGTILNINADTVAAALAAELDRRKAGVRHRRAGHPARPGRPTVTHFSYVDRQTLAQLREDGSLAAGMLPKAAAIDRAIARGVKRVHVISHRIPDSLLLEIFTNEGTGTLVVDEHHDADNGRKDRCGVSHDATLGKGPAAGRPACCATRRARITGSTSGWLLTTYADRSPMPKCCTPRACCRAMITMPSARALKTLAADSLSRQVADRS